MKPHGKIRGVPTWLFDHAGYQGLTSEARLVLLTLWCCEQAGLGRIQRLYPAVLADQTGYTVATVEQALHELNDKKWIQWDGRVAWVVEALASDTARVTSPGVHKNLEQTLAALSEGEIPNEFRKKYVTPYQSQEQIKSEDQIKSQEQTQVQHEEQSEREIQKQNQRTGSVSVSGSGPGSDSVSEGSRGPSHTRSLADGPPILSGRSLGAPIGTGGTGGDSPSPPGSAAPPLPQGETALSLSFRRWREKQAAQSAARAASEFESSDSPEEGEGDGEE